MGQLNFFEGEEEENPSDVQQAWDEQSNPSPTSTPRQTPEEHRLDEEPAPTREQPDYAQLAAINRYLRQPKNIPPNEEMRAEPVDWTLEDEIQDRVRRRLKREGLNPFQQEPGYEPEPPTNPRNLPPKPQPFNQDRYPVQAEQNWPGIPEIQHPYATALNLASKGAGMVREAFNPTSPELDPRSMRNLMPQELLRQARQLVVDDEDLAEIKRNPTGLRAMGAYAQAAIALSRGAGKGEKLNWRMVPGEEWHSWKQVQEPMWGQDPGKLPENIRPGVRQDPEGNYYEWQGNHVTQHPVDTESGRTWEEKHHVIAIPVEGPTGSEGWKQRPPNPSKYLSDEKWNSWTPEQQKAFMDNLEKLRPIDLNKWEQTRWKLPPDDWEMYGRPPDNEPPL